MVLRFDKESLAMQHVLDGSASVFYPHIANLRNAFGAQPFSPKGMSQEIGFTRPTATE
jgi:hypothetical protein